MDPALQGVDHLSDEVVCPPCPSHSPGSPHLRALGPPCPPRGLRSGPTGRSWFHPITRSWLLGLPPPRGLGSTPARMSRCNRARQRPGPDNDHTIWSFSGPEISGPDNDHLGLDNDQLLCGPEILGPHNNVGIIIRSLSGPETPGSPRCVVVLGPPLQQGLVSTTWS